MAKNKVSTDYRARLELNAGTFVENVAKTAQEAVMGLQVDYTQAKTKGLFTLEYAGKTAQKLFPLTMLRRIVVNKLRKAQVGRDLEYLLK